MSWHTDFARLETGKYPCRRREYLRHCQRIQHQAPFAECDPESHRDYADIQIMISGAERFGYTPLTRTRFAGAPYDPEKDVAFYYALAGRRA
jgi:biofilm protein TabA